jgi:hypothetical protein
MLQQIIVILIIISSIYLICKKVFKKKDCSNECNGCELKDTCNMEKIKKLVQVEVTKYKTTDGKEFDSEHEAKFHEEVLAGKKKHCTKCDGKGHINERYEDEWINTSWIPDEGEYYSELKYDKCPDCNGKGYLVMGWH